MPDLVCYACGDRYPLAERKRCACGEPLWFPEATSFDWPPDRDEPGMWRYGDLLPVPRPSGVGSAAGGTPLIRTERLDDYAGCRVHVKEEGENPTGSFKDRGSAVGVAFAAERGRDWVGTVSHGNMAMSVAAHAAGHGLACVVLVPADISAERLRNIARYRPTTVRVDGDYGELYFDALRIGADLGIEFVNSDTPLRVAGQKTVALEIVEAFTPDVPDAIVLPVSSGGLASATWKALRELRAAGLLDDSPRIFAVQSAACDPIVRAFEAGAERVTPVEADETIAASIANANPPSGTRALAALRATGGGAVSVPDPEIREAKRRLARDAGLCVEASSAVALAGARRLAERGDIAADDELAVVATGSGFKEAGEFEGPEAELRSRDGLADRLAALAGRHG